MMQGNWRRDDVDFVRSVRYQDGYFNPRSVYKPMPIVPGVEGVIEEVLEMQNRTYDCLMKKMDQLFFTIDARIGSLRMDFGRLNERIEEIERVVGVKKVAKRPEVVRAIHTQKPNEEKIVEETSESSSDVIGRLPSMVGRRVAGRWTLEEIDRPVFPGEEIKTPLMQIPPKKKALRTWSTNQSVYPWIPIHEYEIDEPGFDIDEEDNWELKREVETYSKVLMRRMPFARACKLEKELEKILSKVMRWEISPEEANAIFAAICDKAIMYRMPDKKKDPGQFELNITIGAQEFTRCLCDLGASSNTIPLKAMRKLPAYELRPTKKEMRLADDTSVIPLGKLKNLPCMIGDRFIAVDFYVLETCYADESDGIEQIILGRSFLKTAGALIDCNDDTITLRNLGTPSLVFKIKEKEVDYARSYDDIFKKENLAVLTRSKPRMRVIENREEEVFRYPSRPTPSEIGRLASPEAKRRAISMPTLSPFTRELQSTSVWIRPEQIDHRITHHANSLKIMEGQFKYDVETTIKECKELWPILDHCGMDLELEELVPYVLKGQMTVKEFCSRLSKTCDAKIRQTIPKKFGESGRIEISCMIGNTWFEKVPCDTGAGVNLMSLAVAKALKFEKTINKKILLRFADDTYKLTEGVLEDVPLHTNGQFIATDFHVMRYDVEAEDAMILGRPFLHTAYAEIDCRNGVIKFKAKNANEEELIKKNGNKPPGFEGAGIKGMFTPIQRFKRPAPSTQVMCTASISLERSRKQEKNQVIDLTEEDEEDDEVEEDPMEEQDPSMVLSSEDEGE